MDPVRNPFAPGAGTPPPELAGRAGVLNDIDLALQRIAAGRSSQSSILVGLRGVGKTVVLVKAREHAEARAYKTLFIEAHEAKPLPELLIPGLRSILFSLSGIENGKELARRALRVLKGFVSGMKAKLGDVEFGLSVNPEPGTADSGLLEADLPDLFVAVGEAAKAAAKPVAIFVDELQYLSSEEFSALIMAIHRTSQMALPVILVGAGLPQIPGLVGNSKSYSERLFKFPRVGALPEPDARLAVQRPVEHEGASIDEAGLVHLLEITGRYPYFIQQWAYDAWNAAPGSLITANDVRNATPTSMAALDNDFFRVRFDRCTNAEKRYMRALAEFGPGPHKSGDVAVKLGKKSSSLGPVRDTLIKKGMIYAPQHGEVAFTVPLFDSYMLRVMPEL